MQTSLDLENGRDVDEAVRLLGEARDVIVGIRKRAAQAGDGSARWTAVSFLADDVRRAADRLEELVK